MMSRTFTIAAAILGFLGVALGAFGAHGLETALVANGRTDTFETATRYLMYHALALLAVAWLEANASTQWPRRAGWLFIAGTIVFSGSLMVLAIFDLRLMGAIAPLGGVLLLGGWACVGLAAWQNPAATS